MPNAVNAMIISLATAEEPFFASAYVIRA